MNDEEREEQGPPQGPPGPHELENGIFALVVTLTRTLTTELGADGAREYVSTYLERLAGGLRSTGAEKGT